MLLTVDGHVPVHWWTHAVNFGDLLAPWLVEKITGRKVVYAEQYDPSYLVIGSILGHATPASIVWGTGSFGTAGERDESMTNHGGSVTLRRARRHLPGRSVVEEATGTSP